jgi:Prokaryotic homologs of the JAB domain
MTARLWRVWIAEDAAAAIGRAARSAHPRETGGVLAGVLTHGSRPWVTHAVELRSAKATGSSYELPAGARRKAIARLRRDDPRLGYVGEWHVHPADVEPSTVDNATIRRLAADPDSGCTRPLLLVARRTPSGYVLDARQLTGGKLREQRIIATGSLKAPESSSRLKARSGARRLYLGIR